MSDREQDEVEHLNRLWDASVGSGGPLRPDGFTDLAEAIAALHAADDAPEPDLDFVVRLRREVLAVDEPAPRLVPAGARSLGLVWPAPSAIPRRSVVRLAVAAIAAAILVAALSGGGRWLSGTGPAPMVASAMASPVPVHPTAQPTLPGSEVGQALREGPRTGAAAETREATVVPAPPRHASLNQRTMQERRDLMPVLAPSGNRT
ncbi:MAG TPA: hypothetical protein VKB09_17045 [Thermomicrobiales bacterium]|nr:hypothetical protein [Thermomicrobiales bacterium]